MPPPASGQRPAGAPPAMTIITNFYKEEFLKHQQLLHQQREYYSERAMASAEAALDRILAQIEVLCRQDHADLLVSRLLRSFDLVTRVSALSDPKKVN